MHDQAGEGVPEGPPSSATIPGGAGHSSDAGSGSHHGTQAQERPSTAVLGLWVALNHLLLSRRTFSDDGAVEQDVERMKYHEEG